MNKIRIFLSFWILHHRGRLTRYWIWYTASEWIASETAHTTTNGVMINSTAHSMKTTDTRTWINTLMIDTSTIETTFGINRTFGTASGWYAQVAGNARAHRMIIDHTTITIQATWRWYTWIANWYRQIGFCGLVDVEKYQQINHHNKTERTRRTNRRPRGWKT